MSSPSSSYGAHSPDSCDASTPSASPSSSTASVNAAPTPAKKRPRVSPDDPARLARLAARQARNRQSAQNSRDRKKAEQSAIEEEVITLRQRNAELEAKVAETEKGISALMDLVKVLMKSSVPPPSPSTQEQVAPTTVALSAPAVPAYSPDSLLTASQSSLVPFTTDSSLASHLSSSLLPSTDSLAAPMVPASSTSTLSPFSAPSASLLSTTSSHHSSSTANVCHPAAMVNHSLQRTLAGVTPTSVDEETRSGGESTRMSRVWDHHYGSSVRVVEDSSERGMGVGKQGEESSDDGEQQRQQDSVEQVVKAEQQVEGVTASGEDLGQLNHRLASELLEAILGEAAAQQDGAGEGHPQTSYQQQEDQGVYGSTEEATGMVSVAPASDVGINTADPASASSWDFNSLGLDLGLDLSVDMNLDLDLHLDQQDHDVSGCSTPLGEPVDSNAAEQDVDDAVWRGVVDSSLLQVY
ncbi:hypothetical protein BCV69DRAFT_294051 [Microstroma glucosiphilum]|uniref:BZIP domain-containing protein n=1 Tax=Pseudomicrostroma glucosiphilum TaxID=1684307 RepID=A0A316U673_9BASI|nr:hypothetical protein BCV69DRAFT_294051 [Pseudomicrostroma glucosiphilum]PWN20328.1 hypothetical protein BCV69DRAFT_294051 [Pseudomicrostroma glucosiphilum]